MGDYLYHVDYPSGDLAAAYQVAANHEEDVPASAKDERAEGEISG